jgi:DNA-binding beta-propeller fold protein YncE
VLFIKQRLRFSRLKRFTLSLLSLALILVFRCEFGFAQAPNISYGTSYPLPYPVGSAITTLTPTNTGGSTTSGFYSFTTFVNLTGNAYGVATDAFSNVYTADYTASKIYKYNSSGVGGALTITGGTLSNPTYMTTDASNNIYVTNFGSKVVYKMSYSGVVTATINGFTNDPYGVVTDASNNLYIVDVNTTSGAGVIRKVAAGATGTVTGTTIITISAGTPLGLAIVGNDLYVSLYSSNTVVKYANAVTGGTTQTAFASGFTGPRNLGNDASGNLYVADYGNNRLQVIPPAGGTGTTVISGLSSPRDLAFDVSGNLYISNGTANDIIRSIPGNYSISPVLPAGLSFNSTTGAISGTPTTITSSAAYTITGGNSSGTSSTTVTLSVIAAAPSISYSQSSYTFGFSSAVSIAPTNSGGSIPATTYGTVSLFAGDSGGASGSSNTGIGTFSAPTGITVTNTGTMYVADKTNNEIRAITPAAVVSTFAGTTTAGRSNTGIGTFNTPDDVTSDLSGNLYVADFGNNEIRALTSAPVVTLLAGSATGASGSTNSPALFHSPSGSAFDATTGAVYIADQANALIRKVIVSSGVTSTFGTGVTYTTPTSVAVDASGNVYVADKGLNKIIKITSGGTASVFAGSGAASSVDGTGTTATFNGPDGITIDKAGNIYVSEGTGNKIRMITTPGAVVTTVAGSGTAGHGNGVGTAAKFTGPAGLDVDPTTGNIFVADAGSNEIREIIGTGYSISPTTLPTGLTFDPTTGTISGTTSASVASGPTTYTITGFNAAGSSVATITITVALIVPNISYSASPVSLLVNTAVGTAPNPTVTVSNTGGAVGTFGYGAATTLTTTGISSPIGISFDASGNLYVVNSGGKIYKYTGATGTAAQFASSVTMTNPVGVVFDSGGNCYVLDASGTKIYKISSSGSSLTTITLTGATTVSGIAIDASNNLYITNYNGTTSSSIIKYNTGTSTQSTFATGTNNKPCGIAVDNAGNVYVTNLGANTATKYNTSGTIVTASFATGFNSPRSIWIDGSDNVYIGDAGTANKIFVYSTYPSSTVAGTALTNFTSTAPYGGDSDSQGDIYVTNNTGNLVYKYAPTGGYFASALPTGLALVSSTGALSTSSTPTAVSPATNYTITAWDAAGSDNTLLNITCYNTYRWVGNGTGTKTNWNDGTNWNGGVVPSSADQAQIGVVAGAVNNMPIIPTGTTINVGSIVMGTLATTTPSPVITVNGTGVLNVSGDITYESTNTGAATTSPGASLAGTGTISANNLNVTLASSTSTGTYNETLSSSITILNLNGNVNLVSTNTGGGTKYQNAIFNLTGGTLTTNGFTSTNAVAGNTSTFGISTGTTLNFTGTAAFSGLSSTGTNTITGLGGTGVTLGYTGNNAQTVYTDAAIAHSSLTSGITYTNLAFSGTSSIKTALSGNVNVTGSFTNSMVSDATTNYVDFSSPTVNFTGSAAQALAGGTGVGTTFYNVTFSGNSTKTMSGLFNIASTGTLNMNGTSSANILNAGTAVLTLKSDAGSSATVGAINSGQTITGTVNVQRFLTGGTGMRGYRLLTSPVYGSTANGNNIYTLNYLANSCYITGTTVSTGGIDKAGNPTLFLFRENVTPTQISFTAGNFRGVGNMGTTGVSNYSYSIDIDGAGYNVPVGNGFLFFFRGDRSVALIGAETVSTYVPTNTVLTTTGTLNQGNITVHDWYTPSSGNLGWTNTTSPAPGNGAVQGYNLVGNPYASPISWTAVYAASTGVGVTTYQFNPATNQYAAFIEGAASGTGGSGDVIGSGQGFFVVASNASAVLNFSEAEKVTSQPSTLLFPAQTPSTTVTQQYLHLKMIKDSVNYDDVIIGFKPGASPKYSVNEDAIHLKGNAPPETLTALSSDSVGLSINYLPLPVQQNTQTVVGLTVSAAASGQFTFSRTELVGIPTIYDIWLKDNLLKDSVDFRANSTYSFDIDNTNPSTYGSNRFQLVFRQNPALSLHLLNFTGSKVANTQLQSQITWTVENESNYTTFNVQRSTDGGKTYSSIGTIQSNGSGTYNYVDNNPVLGQNMYRIQIADLNNNISYSQVITLQFSNLSNNGLAGTLSVYPNPAHSVLNISINAAGSASAYSLIITTNTGTAVRTISNVAPTSQQDVSSLAPGTYYITMIDNGTKTVIAKSKFVKL